MAARSTGSRPRLLVVDDEPLVRRAQVRFFGDSVISYSASGPTAAKALLRTVAVDAVLTDFDMPPDDNGLRLLEYVRQQYPETARYLMSSGPPLDLQDHLVSGLVQRFFPKLTVPTAVQAVAQDWQRRERTGRIFSRGAEADHPSQVQHPSL